MLIERFLKWLNEGYPSRDALESVSVNQTPKRLLTPPRVPLQIAERSLPSPERLWEIADEYDAKRLQLSNEQFDAFASSGYPNFVQWVESLVEKSAAFGGHLLLLTFDNSTGIVTATTPEPREILPPTSYALPISQSTVQRLAIAVADHFQKANFRVNMTRQERRCSRLGTQLAPAYDCLDIIWAETQERWGALEHSPIEHAVL